MIVIKVDWDKVDPKVIELCDLVAKAHSIYVNLPPSGQAEADLYWDEKVNRKERKM